ncbi:HNH endonuclease [Nakamurella aerolata]|uniref:HNH nuclease domain-containing protein n=1 Tax=Nakamurella aerolata TaxID=1656892 RepID=A0A849A544_9ACTN|nr:HNH endonuclease signature motif containing protein [Nakamurella aerolata]NNG34756.1 hypothetical protein [Nakamurella aerolata]
MERIGGGVEDEGGGAVAPERQDSSRPAAAAGDSGSPDPREECRSVDDEVRVGSGVGVAGGESAHNGYTVVPSEVALAELSDAERAELLDAKATSAVGGLAVTMPLMQPAVGQQECLARIELLHQLQAAVAGQLVVEQARFADLERQRQQDAGVRARDLGRGTANEVGFVRGMAPVAAGREIALSRRLIVRAPETLRRLRSGEVPWSHCRILDSETSHLDDEQARLIDAGLAGSLHGWNRAQAQQAVRHACYQLDPRSAVERRARAEQDRRVTIRPMPDTMTMVSALLPVAQGVATFAALTRDAEAARSAGDARTKTQLMADLLVARCVGAPAVSPEIPQASTDVPADAVTDDNSAADDNVVANDESAAKSNTANPNNAPNDDSATDAQASGAPSSSADPPVPRWQPDTTLNVTISADALWGRSQQPGYLQGFGPVPADLARELAVGPLDPKSLPPRSRVWLRRVVTDPVTGIAMAADPRRRRFDAGVRKLIALRDRRCREPYCDAPIRHTDHVEPYRRGGPSTLDNGQGLCAGGNYVKEIPGWRSEPGPGGTVTVTTPMGRRYRTRPPRPTGLPPVTEQLEAADG